jgi:NCAIR mutase (PurE)-related protein
VDHHRCIRTGFPEVIFCQGKTGAQVAEIFGHMGGIHSTVLDTRATPEIYSQVRGTSPAAVYFETARCIVYGMPEKPARPGTVLVISAGTADQLWRKKPRYVARQWATMWPASMTSA